MAVYKIFPTKDATIYSEELTKNTGIDEILELTNKLNSTNPSISGSIITDVSRVLIDFPMSDINDVIANKVSGDYSASLKLFLAHASHIPVDYTIEAYGVSQSWAMGTGRSNNQPITSNGVSWRYAQGTGSTVWGTGSFVSNVTTGSYFSSSNYLVEGGGNWYVQSGSSQTFNYTSSKDIDMDVYDMIQLWRNSSLQHNGVILKVQDSQEFNSDHLYDVKFFSMDTHTVYPPQIEIKWDDSSFNTGSSVFTEVTNRNFMMSFDNNMVHFPEKSIYDFRILVRDKFPARVYTTSSIYLNNRYLPTNSYWSLRDAHTEETIIDFDNQHTRISRDSDSNYFRLYMDGLQPERFYKFLIKTVINGEEIIVEDDYFFKVTL